MSQPCPRNACHVKTFTAAADDSLPDVVASHITQAQTDRTGMVETAALWCTGALFCSHSSTKTEEDSVDGRTRPEHLVSCASGP